MSFHESIRQRHCVDQAKILVLGLPNSGKSSIVHQLADQVGLGSPKQQPTSLQESDLQGATMDTITQRRRWGKLGFFGMIAALLVIVMYEYAPGYYAWMVRVMLSVGAMAVEKAEADTFAFVVALTGTMCLASLMYTPIIGLLSRLKGATDVTTGALHVDTTHMQWNDVRLTVFDFGGTTDWRRPQWKAYLNQADAVVWVVDSTDRTHLETCREELLALLKQKELDGIPLVVYANKLDLTEDSPLDVNEVRQTPRLIRSV